MSFNIIASLFLFTFSGVLAAQKRDSVPVHDSIPSHDLGEVVITANRYGSFQMNTPEAIRVIDSKSIQQLQLRTSPEALQTTPGVFVQKTNHGGGSPFLRGLTGNQTLLLIDGIRLSNSTFRYGPNQYFNTIDIFSVDKMEVMRGSGSVQYGSDAIGGTIQVFSKELNTSDRSRWGGSLLTRFATQGMEESLHAGVNFSNKKAAFRAGLTGRNFGDIVGGDTTGRQSPTGYMEHDYDLKGKILLSATSSLTLAYNSVHQSDVPVYHKIALENYAVNKMDPQKRELAYIRLNQKLNEGILKSAQFTASYQHSLETRESHKNGSDVLRLENDKVRTLSFSAEAFTSDKNNWSANSGIEIYNDLVKSDRIDNNLSSDLSITSRGLYPDGAKMTSIAVFTLHSYSLKDWNFTAGARFNTFIAKVEDETLGKTTLTPSALVGNLGVLRKLNTTSGLFVSLNTGFRAPNIDDLGTLGIVDFRYEKPDFNLKPEHSFQYQLGYKYNNGKLRGELYVYRNELRNLIVRKKVEGESIEGYQVYTKENAEHSYIQGIEASLDYELNRSWLFSGSVTYTYGQNVTNNEPVRRIPPVFGRLAAEYSHKNWWINTEWQAAGKQDRLAAGDKSDNRIPVGGTPGWNIFNVSTGYSLHYVKINVSLLNLLNEDYRFHGSGVNGYGRSAFVTLLFNI
ncbi:MAG: TonB-dependent receptor [Bacteroidales bacterium]|nr:TonB-dependent receptor [Bacteroidales bacterium]